MGDFRIYVMKQMEAKLIELMGEEAYSAFSKKIATEGFRKEVNSMEDGDFKNFVIEHFDEITKMQ